MKARVRDVMAFSMRPRSMLRVTASASTNTGFAPTARTTFAVATQLSGVVMTSSPGPMPQMRKANSSVAVPEFARRTGRPPHRSDSAASRAWHFGPVVNQPERSTSPTSAMVRSSTLGRVKGRNGAALIACSRCARPAPRRR